MDEVRRRRRIRQLQERRRRAAIRRRNALAGAALVSLVLGVILGANAGGSNEKGGRIAPGFQDAQLVHTQDPVPILMYHVIGIAPGSAKLPDLFVDPETFKQEMQWLDDRGYTGVTLDQVYDAWFEDAKIPENPIVISFDDGYLGDYVFARPDLLEHGWPGVLNLKENTLDPGGELTVDMVKSLINHHWEIDSHTVNHLDVSTLSGAALQREVGQSRTDLQKRFGVPVDFFCYPFGRYDAKAIAAVKAAGYLGATTEDEGLTQKSEMFTLKRIRVNGSDGVTGLERKLEEAGA